MSGGITSIQARIAAIQMRFEPATGVGTSAPLGGSSTTPGTDATTTAGDGSFAAAFQQALGSTGTGLLDGTGPGLGSGLGTALAGVGAAGTTGRTAAVRKAPGDYGKLEPPAELVRYGNGKIPTEALTEIGVGNHRLYAPAAQAFRQMRAAAAADGVTVGVTDSYRSYASQVDLAKRKGLYSQGGLAATPGTSNHGWGLATDLDLDTKALAWMRQNGPQYGFVEDTPREPWHWTFRPGS